MSIQTDLDDVRIFVIAAQAGTLSAAAISLHHPVSTISRALTRLEKRLGVILARRGRSGLSLTDAGKEYLLTSRGALRMLKDAEDALNNRRANPVGLLKIACPVTMARDLMAPLLVDFLARFPELRMEIEPYCSGWDREPMEDIDVYFKLTAPHDSVRKVRAFPGISRGLFASRTYLKTHGSPSSPNELPSHRCAGFGVWRLTRGRRQVAPNITFHIVSSDPGVNLRFVLDGGGIAVLPMYMGRHPEHRDRIVQVLPLWKPEPFRVCALFYGASRLTPKVQTFLEFLAEYIGTERDPRLHCGSAKDYFTDINQSPTEVKTASRALHS